MEFGCKQTVTQDSATEWVFTENIYIAPVFSSQSAQTRIKEFLPAKTHHACILFLLTCVVFKRIKIFAWFQSFRDGVLYCWNGAAISPVVLLRMVLTKINKIQHPHVGRNCGRLCYVERSVLNMTLKLFHRGLWVTQCQHQLQIWLVLGPDLFFEGSIKFRGGFWQNVRFCWNFETDHAHILVVGL